jgi:hypothetical protein
MYRLHAGWAFGSGAIAGTFARSGLLAAFDFMDGGIACAGANCYPFFEDIAAGSMALLTCWNDGGPRCSAEKGNSLLSTGYRATSGYSAHIESLSSKFDYTSKTATTAGNANAPAAMTGDGTFSVAGVYRFDTSAYNPVWMTGDSNTSLAHSVGLSMTSTGKLSMEWGSQYQYKYATTATFVPTTGQWYFIAASVTAGGAVKLWTGVSGVLVDELAGIARIPTPAGGSPVQTPAVTAAPLWLAGNAAGSANVSYAGLWIYDHALLSVEAQVLYQAAKIKMRERGIAVQ